MNLLYLKKLYIRNYYHGVIGIFLKSNIKAKMPLIFNDFMKVNIDGHIEPQIVP